MTFQSRNIQKLDSQNYRLTGVLSMKGIDREVFFHVEFWDSEKDPGGNEKAGFSITGKINRRDWGLNWNAAPDAGGVLVSDDVRMTAELQFFEKKLIGGKWGFYFSAVVELRSLTAVFYPDFYFLIQGLSGNSNNFILLLHRPAQWLKINSNCQSWYINWFTVAGFVLIYCAFISNTAEKLCSKCLVTFILYKHSIAHRSDRRGNFPRIQNEPLQDLLMLNSVIIGLH